MEDRDFPDCCADANTYTRTVETWRRILIDAKESKRLTLDELAERSGLNRGTIQRVLDRSTSEPGFDTVVKLAAAFGPEVTERIANTIITETGREHGTTEHGTPDRRRTSTGEHTDLLETLLRQLDAEDGERDDTTVGDILKAIAVLTRALRRKPHDPRSSNG